MGQTPCSNENNRNRHQPTMEWLQWDTPLVVSIPIIAHQQLVELTSVDWDEAEQEKLAPNAAGFMMLCCYIFKQDQITGPCPKLSYQLCL